MLNEHFELDIHLDKLSEYCQTQPIQRLALFGSVLREDFTRDSDVDVLVEFVPESGVTYFDLFDIQETLTKIVGYPVDLLTPAALSDYFRHKVLSEAVTIYER